MEDAKLQALHDTIMKLVPRGKSGGLGMNSFAKQAGTKRDPSLPDNALYSYFVRAGDGAHKRQFEEKNEEHASLEDEDDAIRKAAKKAKKLAKQHRTAPAEECPAAEEDEDTKGLDDAGARKAAKKARKLARQQREQEQAEAAVEEARKAAKRAKKREKAVLAQELMPEQDEEVDEVEAAAVRKAARKAAKRAARVELEEQSQKKKRTLER